MTRPPPPELPPTEAVLEQEYGFLVPNLVSIEEFGTAAVVAAATGSLPHAVLIAKGLVTVRDYVAALEQHLGLTGQKCVPNRTCERSVWIQATVDLPSSVAARVEDALGRGFAVLLGATSPFEERLLGVAERRLVESASREFSRSRPELAAASPMPAWQIIACSLAVGLVLGGSAVAPKETLFAAAFTLAIIFIVIVAVRLVAIFLVSSTSEKSTLRRTVAAGFPRTPDGALPRYSVIVALYKEAEVLSDLRDALCRLDYPVNKLEILLVLEADDGDTIRAAHGLGLPPQFRIIVVPDAHPKTKPKALNYALALAQGELVVVYDAEDLPEPNQLRLAVHQFAKGGPDLACLQARLNIHNPSDGWLARQFALEYSALFDGFLPALARLRYPLPLGGTSNHFPAAMLRALGGWDPHNVTEDADLGFRIARYARRIEILHSTTWEEAPATFGPWFRQRTRWLKGWMMTYLVHMRHPGQLLREFGAWKFFGFQVILGGMLLSTLIHPIFYILLAIGLSNGPLFEVGRSTVEDVLVGVAVGNLVAGYLSAIVLAVASVAKRGRAWLAWNILLMPAYWLLISAAAYRAVWQMLNNPYVWEKTPHKPRSVVRP